MARVRKRDSKHNIAAGIAAVTLASGIIAFNTADIPLYLGDQWFCTEKEAQQAGFTKAETCP